MCNASVKKERKLNSVRELLFGRGWLLGGGLLLLRTCAEILSISVRPWQIIWKESRSQTATAAAWRDNKDESQALFSNLNQRFLNFIDTSARTSRSRRATCSTEQPSVRSSFLCITCDKATRSAETEAQPSGCWSGRLQPLASRARSQRLGLKATC